MMIMISQNNYDNESHVAHHYQHVPCHHHQVDDVKDTNPRPELAEIKVEHQNGHRRAGWVRFWCQLDSPDKKIMA